MSLPEAISELLSKPSLLLMPAPGLSQFHRPYLSVLISVWLGLS